MNKTNIYLWLLELGSQILEGLSDNFLAVMTGSAIGSAASSMPPAKVIICTIASSGAIYAASFVKKNPRPWAYVPPVAPAPAPSSLATSSQLPAPSVPSV